jgi:hypothetical protein
VRRETWHPSGLLQNNNAPIWGPVDLSISTRP